jgi:hypothetical protein
MALSGNSILEFTNNTVVGTLSASDPEGGKIFFRVVTAKQFFGPKAAGVWPASVSIAGPTGPTGSLTINDVIAAIGSNATLRAAIKSAATS